MCEIGLSSFEGSNKNLKRIESLHHWPARQSRHHLDLHVCALESCTVCSSGFDCHFCKDKTRLSCLLHCLSATAVRHSQKLLHFAADAHVACFFNCWAHTLLFQERLLQLADLAPSCVISFLKLSIWSYYGSIRHSYKLSFNEFSAHLLPYNFHSHLQMCFIFCLCSLAAIQHRCITFLLCCSFTWIVVWPSLAIQPYLWLQFTYFFHHWLQVLSKDLCSACAKPIVHGGLLLFFLPSLLNCHYLWHFHSWNLESLLFLMVAVITASMPFYLLFSLTKAAVTTGLLLLSCATHSSSSSMQLTPLLFLLPFIA